MQKSFQFNHDKGASGNHTHKYSKLIKAVDRSVIFFFTAYHTTLSSLSKIKTSFLTFTKVNFEIEPIMKKLKKLEKSLMPGLYCDMRRTM